MKLLWAVHVIPKDYSEHLQIERLFFGGWVESMIRNLKKVPGVQLGIACKSEQTIDEVYTVDNVTYFPINYNSSVSIEQQCADIVEAFQPDLIHVEGTEFVQSSLMMQIAKSKGIPHVVSLQGILCGLYDYQCGGLQMDEVLLSQGIINSFAGLVMHFRKTIWFKKRLASEKKALKLAENIVGRTTWDRAHSYAINPKAGYFTCNRTLRESFYHTKWDISGAERHSIFVGNSYFPLKGFHFVVQAIPYLIHEYPDLKVYVAGDRPYSDRDKRSILKKGYSIFLKHLIQKLDVEKYIHFLGPLQENGVADKLAHVHAYVLCSVAENSPNTLGEAMLVGTPCVSSYVGGAPDMATDGVEALFYRANDPVLLAWNIKRIFDDDALALRLSENGHKRAAVTHDPEKNAAQLYNIYQEILTDAGKQ